MTNINNFLFVFIILSFIGFILIVPTLINFILLCEIVWIGIYMLVITYSVSYDALLYLVFGILLLCVAAGESAIGLALLMFQYMMFGMIKITDSSLLSTGNYLNNYW